MAECDLGRVGWCVSPRTPLPCRSRGCVQLPTHISSVNAGKIRGIIKSAEEPTVLAQLAALLDVGTLLRSATARLEGDGLLVLHAAVWIEELLEALHGCEFTNTKRVIVEHSPAATSAALRTGALLEAKAKVRDCVKYVQELFIGRGAELNAQYVTLKAAAVWHPGRARRLVDDECAREMLACLKFGSGLLDALVGAAALPCALSLLPYACALHTHARDC